MYFQFVYRLNFKKIKTSEFEETAPLKENLAFLPTNRIGGGVRVKRIVPLIVSVFYFHNRKEIVRINSFSLLKYKRQIKNSICERTDKPQ